MSRISVTLDQEHEQTIDSVQSEIDDESKAAAVRECITRASQLMQVRAEAQQEVRELESELHRLRDRREELIRKEERLAFVEDEVERLRDERDQLAARYHENQAKLKLHRSEKGWVARTKERLFG